jgi:hypothetical protein
MPFCTVCGIETEKLDGKCSACGPKFAFCVECGIEKEKEKFNNSKRCSNCLLVMKNIRINGSKTERRKPLNKTREFALGSLIGLLIASLYIIPVLLTGDETVFAVGCLFSFLAIIISVIYYSVNRRFVCVGGILFGTILPILLPLLIQLLGSA